MKKLVIKIVALISAVAMLVTALASCSRKPNDKWKTEFDVAIPVVDNAGSDEASANADGWYLTMSEDFEGDTLPSQFAPSPHGLRKTEYWCDNMVSIKDGNVVVKATKETDHVCDICPKEGNFTSGIETRKMVDGKSVSLFEQAFGYYEARVKIPTAGGMWSAFWLQCDTMSNVGNKGEDGSEIDIYESSFFNTNKNETGHCIHYDGYESKHKQSDAIVDAGSNLYEGYHTYALKWTPTEYVFYIDGKATWATDFGGVCKVPAFIRFTNEIRGNVVGPYGQKLGDFTPGEFNIDYIRVYQNKNYLNEIKAPSDFK